MFKFDNIWYVESTEIYYTGSGWTSDVQTFETPYSVSGDTLILYQDFDQNGTTDVTWTLTRQ